jgi:hypothetical protein
MDESLKNRALKIFEKEQTQLDDAFKAQSPGVEAPKKVEKVTVIQNDDGTWSKNVEKADSNFYDDTVVGTVEAEIKNDATTLQEFCREFDDRILSFNSQINVKKQQIVTLSTEAIARNCWPGIAYSTLLSGGTTRQIGSTTQNFGNPYDVIEDREALEVYDKMAGPSVDYGADNPFEPTKIVTLTSSYSGFGHETQRDNGRLESGDAATEVLASDYNIGGGDEDNDPYLTSFQSSSSLGTGRDDVSTTASDHSGPRNVAPFRAYAGVGVAPDATDTSLTGSAGETRCVAIANEISTLISEIQTLRSQRDAAVNRTNLNTIKDKKMNKELQDWGAENVKAKQTQRKTLNSSVISAVNSMT